MADLEKALEALGSGQVTIGTTDANTTPPHSPVKSGSSGFWSLLQRSQRSDTTNSAEEFIEDEDEREPVVRQLETCPDGYPRLAAFLDSDDNFMVYRRYGYLHARLLLKKQEELRQLERRLDDMDDEDKVVRPGSLVTMHSGNDERANQRRELEEEIEKKLLEYDNLLQSVLALVHCNRPSSSEYRSVENFIHNRQPLEGPEQAFVYRREDLITLRPGREHAWLDSSVERLLKTMKCKFIQHIFCSKETLKKTDGDEVYYSRERIEAFVVATIVLMILALLVIPIYVLYHLTVNAETPRSNAICIGILLVATLLFSACISLFTRAKRHEILAASAAYCAVLVVFISNIGNVGTVRSLGHG